MNRKRQIRLALLRLIVQTDEQGFAAAEDILFRDLRGIHPAPGVGEVSLILTEMDVAKQIVTVPDEDTRRFAPTAAGRALLLKEAQGL